MHVVMKYPFIFVVKNETADAKTSQQKVFGKFGSSPRVNPDFFLFSDILHL